MNTYFPVSNYLAEVSKILQDEVGVIYDPVTELLPALNNGCAATVAADPQALVFNVPFQLTPFVLALKSGGSGYVEGETIVLAGGTSTDTIKVVVAGEQGGVIDAIDVTDFGSYTAYPSNPIAQASSSGTGVGATFTLSKIGPRQELTPDGASLIDVRMNLGVDGQTMSNAITKVPKDSLDASRPSWPMDVCGISEQPTTPQHYMTDPDDPKRWYLWPYPNVMSSPWFVQLIYRSVANDVGLTDAFPLPSLYWNVVKAYMLWHVPLRLDKRGMDASMAAAIDKLVTSSMNEFNTALGLTAAATRKTIPRDTVNKQT